MRTLTRGHFKAGYASVRSAKLRSFWTMLGVIIGVASVILVVAIGEGIKQQIGGQIHRYGSNIITIRPTQLHGTADAGSNDFNALSGLSITAPFTQKDILTVGQTKGVSASAPLSLVSGQVKGETGPYHGGVVIGTTPDLPSLLNQSMAYGVFLSVNDTGMNAAVLGQKAANQLFDEDVPLGRRFTFHGEEFIVRGIFNQFNATPLSQQADFNRAIFIPNDVAERLSKNTAPTYQIMARASADERSQQVAANIKRSLTKVRGGDDSFSVLVGNQNLAASDSILNLLTRLIAGVAAISLLVGGIGIMNVMLVSVAERTHEIGIRKAVGATNQQILSQFLVESSLLSLTGGLTGVGIALLADLVLRLTTSLTPVISWQVVLLASGVSLLIGIIFGTVPAFKAARKDPIDALRSE